MEQLLQQIPEDKLPVARQIVSIARSQGVDPALALAVAFQESGLDQSKTGGKGEIGIMQVMPTTGQMLGFKLEDLKRPETNILAGVTYLRQGIDKFGDPMLAVAGYNAGHDHPFFTNPNKSKLPNSTRSYVKNIASLGVFEPREEREPPEMTEAQGKLEQAPPATPQPRQRVTFGDMAEKLSELASEADVGQLAADVAGATIGNLAAKKFPGTGVLPAATTPTAGALPTAASPTVAVPGTSMPAAQGPIQGPPAGGRMTQNWIRAQDALGSYEDVAQKARSLGEAHQMKEAAIQAENKIRSMAPEMRQAPERAGLFIPSQTGAGPRGARTAPIPVPKGPGLFRRGSAAMGAMPRLPGIIGGIGAAEGLLETGRRLEEDDLIGAGIAGLGTLGGAAAMTPYGPARLIGTAAATASPLAMYFYDKMMRKQEGNIPLPLVYRSRYGG